MSLIPRNNFDTTHTGIDNYLYLESFFKKNKSILNLNREKCSIDKATRIGKCIQTNQTPTLVYFTSTSQRLFHRVKKKKKKKKKKNTTQKSVPFTRRKEAYITNIATSFDPKCTAHRRPWLLFPVGTRQRIPIIVAKIRSWVIIANEE